MFEALLLVAWLIVSIIIGVAIGRGETNPKCDTLYKAGEVKATLLLCPNYEVTTKLKDMAK